VAPILEDLRPPYYKLLARMPNDTVAELSWLFVLADGVSRRSRSAMISEEQVRSALAHVKYPVLARHCSFGSVKAVHVEGSIRAGGITLATRDANVPRQNSRAGHETR